MDSDFNRGKELVRTKERHKGGRTVAVTTVKRTDYRKAGSFLVGTTPGQH